MACQTAVEADVSACGRVLQVLVLCFAVFLGSPLSLRGVGDVSTSRTAGAADVAVPHLDPALPDVTSLDSDAKRLEKESTASDAYSTPTCECVPLG